MDKLLIVDGHCDSILEAAKGIRSLAEKSELGHLDFSRLQGRVNLQFLALFIESVYKPSNTLLRTLELIDTANCEISRVNYISKVLVKSDLNCFEDLEVKILLAVEGGEALCGSLAVLRSLFALGIRSITLTWNHCNEIADGCGVGNYGRGLSLFGREVVNEMNRLGMAVDVSHLSDKSFWDVLEISSQPIIASHSCCKKLVPHPRNLSDEQLKAVAMNKGIIGINFYPAFLNTIPSEATIDDIVKHIIYAAEVAGTEHVGLGSDFDGIDQVPLGMEDVTKINLLASKLEKAGFTSKEIANIMGNNFIRVLKKVLPDG
ncbi:MAG: dipeptidase [Bacillota bacterium]